MITVAERITVAFAGGGGGVEELSWGQRDIWLVMVRQKFWLPIGGWKRLPEGTTVQDVAEELRYLMSRYQSMRTRLRFDDDGRPSQVVFSAGEIGLDVIDIGDEDDPDVFAERVQDWYKDTDYDFVGEWPVRMAVLRRDGVPSHLVVIMCHLVSDGYGGMVMVEEVGARETAPVQGMQAVAQARWQRSPAGRRLTEAALRYWEGALRMIPERRLRESTDKRQPRHWRGEFTSRSLRLALRAITARAQVNSHPVLLALFAVALARVGGTNPVAFRMMVNNRFRPGLSRVVSTVAQSGLCVLDIADTTFEEAIGRARRAAMATYKHAYYDPDRMDELVARVAQERGPDFEISCFFNDRRVEDPSGPADPVPTIAQIRAAVPHGAFWWVTAQDVPFEPLIVHVDEVADDIHFAIDMDTHYLSPGDAEALMRGIEAAGVEAAEDPTAPTRVAPQPMAVGTP